MKIRKLIAAALSLFMLGVSVRYNVPAVKAFYIIPDAAEGEIMTYDVWSYTENDDGTINIVDCSSTDEEIVFPAELDGKKVRAIKGVLSNEPSYNKTIKSAVISEGIEEVGYFAFGECMKLENVILPEGLKELDYKSFSYCTALESITIPESVEKIGVDAFMSCKKMDSVTIPENVSLIDVGAFDYCSNLKNVYIMNPYCSFANGEIISINEDICFDGTPCNLHGLKGSTTEEYARIWNHSFFVLASDYISITKQSEDVYFQPGDETVHLSVKAESFYDKPLSYSWSLYLPDKEKWYEIQSTDSGEYDMPSFYAGGWTKDEDGAKVLCEVISGNTTREAKQITLHFVDEGSIQITQQPPEIVYFDTYDSAHISLQAEGKDLCYSWYVKSAGFSNYILYDEFAESEWTGSFDFTGLSENGLQESFDGATMYCKVWNRQGAVAESRYFILKKYQGDVDRNISIRMPEVGETYAHYMANVNSIVPAELIIGDEYFGIIPKDASGNYIPGVGYMNDDDVFKAGQRYEFCLKMYLPEYVSPMAIYQFYGKGLIVNGEEHGAADTLDEEELYFWDYWTTPVLEGGLLEGDVNADGKFNISDVVLMQKWLLAVPDTDLVDWKAGDLCEDDKLNVFDLCQMRKMLIK